MTSAFTVMQSDTPRHTIRSNKGKRRISPCNESSSDEPSEHASKAPVLRPRPSVSLSSTTQAKTQQCDRSSKRNPQILSSNESSSSDDMTFRKPKPLSSKQNYLPLLHPNQLALHPKSSVPIHCHSVSLCKSCEVSSSSMIPRSNFHPA